MSCPNASYTTSTCLENTLPLFFWFILFCFCFFYFYFILPYNTVLVLPYIDMNPPRVYMRSQTWTQYIAFRRVSLVAQMVKHLPTMWVTWVRSLGWEDPLGKEMATHSSTLAWKILWTKKLHRLQSDMTEWLTHLEDEALWGQFVVSYHLPYEADQDREFHPYCKLGNICKSII